MHSIKADSKEHLMSLIEEAIELHGPHCDLNHLDVSNVTDMSELFLNSPFDGDISRWDVSHVTNMRLMFGKSRFNGDISSWNVGNVTDMAGMFGKSVFNGDISNWDVSKVKVMQEMFTESVFDGDISRWNISSVDNPHRMFYKAVFNGDISNWNWASMTQHNPVKRMGLLKNIFSKFHHSPMGYAVAMLNSTDPRFAPDPADPRTARYVEMKKQYDTKYYIKKGLEFYTKRMYQEIHDLPIDYGEDAHPDEIDPTKVIRAKSRDHLESLIHGHIEQYGPDCDLNHIDVSGIDDMSHLFRGLRFSGGISKWDTSNVKDMSGMFFDSTFNGDVSRWDVSNVTNMSEMFALEEKKSMKSQMQQKAQGGVQAFTGDISKWDTSKVTNMDLMFANSIFNGDISGWNVSKVTNMDGMFYHSKFQGDISNWDVSKVVNMRGMFCRASSFNGDLSKWNVGQVQDMDHLFERSGFQGDISAWDVSNVTSLKQAFRDTQFNGDLSKWNTSRVVDMSYMFLDCPFQGDISTWDLSSVCSAPFERLDAYLEGDALWIETLEEYAHPSATPTYFKIFHDSPLGFASLLSANNRVYMPEGHPGYESFIHEYTTLKALGILDELTPPQAIDLGMKIYQKVHRLDTPQVELSEAFEFNEASYE